MKSICKVAASILVELYYKFLVSAFGQYCIKQISLVYDNSRQIILKQTLKSCGQNVNFQFPIVVTSPEMVEIANDVSFAGYVHIWGAGGITIGSKVMIGSHTAITSITHDYCVIPMYNKALLKPVVIGNDVWIGTHVVIMPGVCVGDGAVIGAGAIVTKDVLPFTIVAGVPARTLKNRQINDLVN